MTPDLMEAGVEALKHLEEKKSATDSGGRGTLAGAILGAGVVNYGKSFFTQAFPEYWLYFLGALFIAVTLFLPNGIVGLVRKWRAKDTVPSDGRLEAQRALAASEGVEPAALPPPHTTVTPEGARA